MASWWRALPLLLLLSCGGSDDGVLLRVDVLTDFVPGLEFETIEIAVEGADFAFRRPIESGDDFLMGQRVGEFETAGEESLLLVGRLLDRAGATVARRRVSVPLRERSTQTLVFTRSCAEVECPAADPAATECQGGVCVSPDCSPENPDACAAGCTTAADCEAPAATCAEARCTDGVCLDAEAEGSCAAGDVCQPAMGCVTLPDGSDMGMSSTDSGAGDGGVEDGGVFVDMGGLVDFGMAECMVDGDCDDGLYCNGPERCLEGSCAPAESAVSCDDGVACTVDSCDEDADACAATADDGLCTAEADGTCDADTGCQYPVCTAATCVAGPCQTATCDGDLCVRTNLCGGSEICCGGSCAPAGCNDGNPCTDDSCGAGGCVNTNNTDACSDGNACTVGDQCAGGSCGAGSARNCNDGNLCTDDSCNPSSGCVNTNNTVGCSDGDACTVGDQCSGGSCSGGGARNCNDSNPCTNDSCNSSTGCVNSNNTASCNDGDACTINDRCSGGSCGGGGSLNCNDGNVCTTDSCNSSTGCVNSNNTVSCNDGDACTTGDCCAGGSCGGIGALNCNDGNLCTTDSCNPSSGCVNSNNTVSCNDGDACTVNDRCSGGSCSGGGPRNCSDGNPCTTDSCNPSSGCQYGNVSAGTSCGPDNCGPFGPCNGISCDFEEATESRTCTPRECNGSGSCVNGSSYQDTNSCTLQEGDSCALCTECTAEPPMLCIEAFCVGGCCTDGLFPD